MALLLTGLVYTCNKEIVQPFMEREELTTDSMNLYLGKEVILDSTPHVLVSISSLRNGGEYTTDKGITVDFEFVRNYFSDTTRVDTSHSTDVDGQNYQQ